MEKGNAVPESSSHAGDPGTPESKGNESEQNGKSEESKIECKNMGYCLFTEGNIADDGDNQYTKSK